MFVALVTNVLYEKYGRKKGEMPFVCVMEEYHKYLLKNGMIGVYDGFCSSDFFYQTYEEAEQALNAWIEKHPEEFAAYTATRMVG